MIVTCERCETQFQLDDARVPAGGVRVRCSRCKHAFQVMRSEGRSLADAQKPAPPQSDDEESDWQFNADLPIDDPDASHAALRLGGGTAPPDELEDPASQFGWDDEPDMDASLASPSDPAAAADEMAGTDELAEDALSRSGLDLLEDLDRSAPSQPTPPLARGARPTPSAPVGRPAPVFPVAEVAVGATRPGAPLPRPASELAAEADAAGAGGAESEEDWNLFSDDAGEHESKGRRRLAPVVPGAIRADADPVSPRWLRWAGGASRYAGSAFVAVVFLYGLVGAWPATHAAGPPPRQLLGGGLEIAGASGRWVENAAHGPLFVVSGSVWNGGDRSVLPPSLGVAWLDRDGQLLERASIAAATPHRRERLREAPLDELVVGRPLSAGGPLPPGAGVPFELVFPSVPEGAEQFQLIALVAPPPARPRTAPAAASGDGTAGLAPADAGTEASSHTGNALADAADAPPAVPPAAPAP